MITAMKKHALYIGLVTALMVVAFLAAASPVKAGFNNNRVIDDGVFDNAGTMDEGSIQNFLNSFPNSCLKNYQAPYPNDYFNYGGNVPAARVIKRAADLWGINPQVILATLEKEESLVRGNAGCADWRYNSAMGMGCPDGGSCPAPAYAGFSKQVTKGSWQLKFNKERAYGNTGWGDNGNLTYYGYMTQGNRKRCASCANIYYDGWAGIDGVSVHMDTGATASLYSYTPHFHGNQNFVALFEAWFGSTWGSGEPPLATIAHPDGTLVKDTDSPVVYLVADGYRTHLGTEGIFRSFNYHFSSVKPSTEGDRALPTTGPHGTYREGALIKGSSNTVYIVDSSGGTQYKRSLDTFENFTNLGFKFYEVIKVADNELPAETGETITTAAIHPDGVLVRDPASPTVYIIINGERRSMTSLAVFVSHGLDFGTVKVATSADMALPEGTPINYREGALVKGSSPTVYALDYMSGELKKRSLASLENFVGLRYNFTEVLRVTDGELPATGPDIGQ